jgi:ATP-dependent exoDNAse (exonuclease V) beta subunit
MRFYNIDGELYPSVTSLLDEFLPESPFLKQWRLSTPDWKSYMEMKAKVGTVVHAYAANYFRELLHLSLIEENVELTEQQGMEARVAIDNFNKFVSNYNIKPVACEITVYNKELKYAGTVDLIADVDGVPTILDFKTSRMVRATHEAQVVAYKKALLSYPSDPFRVARSRCKIVKLNFQKDLLVWDVYNEGKAWNQFMEAVENYRNKKKVK